MVKAQARAASWNRRWGAGSGEGENIPFGGEVGGAIGGYGKGSGDHD